MHENMRPTSPVNDDPNINYTLSLAEPNINYTLSLAAVKSGFFDAMTNPVVSEAESSEGGYGYEVERREDLPTVDRSPSGAAERETQTEVRVVESSDGSADILTLEVDETGTVESSVYKTLSYTSFGSSSVKAKMKTTKKKISKFIKKSRNKIGAAIRVDEETVTKTRTAPSITSFNVGPVSTGASTVSEDPVHQKSSSKKETTTAIPKDTTKEEVKRRDLPPLPPAPPPPPPPPPPPTVEKLPEVERTASDKDKVPSQVTENKRSHQEQPSTTRSQDEREVSKATKRLDVLLSTDSYETDDAFSRSTQSRRRATDEGDSFTMSKVSERTFIINESGSFVDESWSRDEQPSGGYGCFSCACAPKEEWEEYDDDEETVESDSEEGRVADAVITIQEHASRLGLTEYELLEMIQDE